MDVKNSNQMDELAEQIALEDFDQLHTPHVFSDTYTKKKNRFMEEIKMKEQAKRKKKRLLLAAACLFIGVPTTVLGASKLYDVVVEKQNYEVKVSWLNKLLQNDDRLYKLKVGYLPEGMVQPEKDSMKYSFKDHLYEGGFSFILYRAGENSDFKTLFATNYEEKEINGKRIVIVTKDFGGNAPTPDRETFLFFEKEGVVLRTYVGSDVSMEQLLKVMENVTLEPATKETASFIVDYDEVVKAQKQVAKSQPKEKKVKPLPKDSKNLFQIGETLSVNKNGNDLAYRVEKIEVFDSIKDFDKNNFSGLNDSWFKGLGVLNQENELIPYKRNVYKIGDGKSSLHTLIDSKLIGTKFVYLTTTVKNTGEKSTSEIHMYPQLRTLKSEGNAWTYARNEGLREDTVMRESADYLEPHGEKAKFSNIGSLAPNQEVKVYIGYFVDEDKLGSLFLDYGGDGWNLDTKNRWVDIRQK